MTRRFRAWWKKVRGQVSAFWDRLFRRNQDETSRGLSAPMPEPVVETPPPVDSTASNKSDAASSPVDAEWVEAWVDAEKVESEKVEVNEHVRTEPEFAARLETLAPQEAANLEPAPPVAPSFQKERRRGRTSKPIMQSRNRVEDPVDETGTPVEELEETPVEELEETPVEELEETPVEELEETPVEELEETPVEELEEAPVEELEEAPVEELEEASVEELEEASVEELEEASVEELEETPVEELEEAPVEELEETPVEELEEAPVEETEEAPVEELEEAPVEHPEIPLEETDTTVEELAALEARLELAEHAALEAAELEVPKTRRRTARERLASHELQCWRLLAESELKRQRRSAAEAVEVPNDYVPMAESADILFQLNLSSFEGPLDLLLFLIRRHKIDIFDIPIGFISAQYLRYIKMMEDLNIDVASEFLFMASELLHIKSRMLLPKPAEVEDEDDIDPRAELVQRLLEYQKYKRAASELGDLAWLGRDTFSRAPEKLPPRHGEAPLKEVGVFALIEAFNRVLERQKPEVRHQVLLEQVSVRQRIKQVIQQLIDVDATPFEDLLEGLVERVDIVVTFLACLEMGKRQLLRLYLSESQTLYLQPRFDNLDVAMDRLEGLDEHEYA